MRLGARAGLESGGHPPGHSGAGTGLVGGPGLCAALRLERWQGGDAQAHSPGPHSELEGLQPRRREKRVVGVGNPRKAFGNTITNAGGQTIHLGIDTQHIKDKPEDYFKGALIWPEYGWVMSAPYPTEVEVVDLEHHGLGFGGWTGGGTGGVITRNMRYYLEDKPQYLDDPEGEYWFEKKGAGGRLYLRPPGGIDPNAAQIEAVAGINLER